MIVLKAFVLALASHSQTAIRGNNSAGNVSIRKTPFGEEIFRSLCGLPLLFKDLEWIKSSLAQLQFIELVRIFV
jgi:hypothetical protein